MTFSERMQWASTPDELDNLMLEVRRSGSRNWTLGAARAKVRDDLWSHLAAHFDADGQILPPADRPDLLPETGITADVDWPRGLGLLLQVERLSARLASARNRLKRSSSDSIRAEAPTVNDALEQRGSAAPSDHDAGEDELSVVVEEQGHEQDAVRPDDAVFSPDVHRIFGFMGSLAVEPLFAIRGLLRWYIQSGRDDPTIMDPLNEVIERTAVGKHIGPELLQTLQQLWDDAVRRGFDPDNDLFVGIR